MDITSSITIFVLALLVGFEVISKIPSTLHTPMMSGANSIHGVILIGAIITGSKTNSLIGYILTFIAVAFAAINVFGGYKVTGRMLQMFSGKASENNNGAAVPPPPQQPLLSFWQKVTGFFKGGNK